MKLVPSLSALAVSALAASLVWPISAAAQTAGSSTATAAPLTRAQVRMEAAEFRRTHRWDPATDEWMLKKEFEAPTGIKSRAEVKAERGEFLRTHRWNPADDTWVSTAPAERSSLTRQDVRADTLQFAKTHEWDEVNSMWVDKRPARARK